MTKPNVFIASSVEGLSVAEAVNIKMEYEAKVKQWDNAFDLGSNMKHFSTPNAPMNNPNSKRTLSRTVL